MTAAEPLSRLSDGELEERIERFGRLMEEADQRFQARPYALEDRAERDQWWLARRALLHERSRRQRIAIDLHDDSEITRLQEEDAVLRRALKGGA